MKLIRPPYRLEQLFHHIARVNNIDVIAVHFMQIEIQIRRRAMISRRDKKVKSSSRVCLIREKKGGQERGRA